jgi:hypothetical protein
MMTHELLEDDAILIVSPLEALESQDFDDLARAVDPYIEEHGPLSGLVIETQRFPAWDSFGSLISHLRFVSEHHQKIEKVAAVTDSGFLAILPLVANHFVAAEVRHFDFAEKSAAMQWIRK